MEYIQCTKCGQRLDHRRHKCSIASHAVLGDVTDEWVYTPCVSATCRGIVKYNGHGNGNMVKVKKGMESVAICGECLINMQWR